MEKTIELFAGIDVGKHKVDVHLHPTKEAFTFQIDNEEGMAELIKLLKARGPKRVVFESTGGYGRRLGEALEEAGIVAHCVPAQRVRMFASAIGLNAKTDPIDAEAIARFAGVAKLVDKVELSPATRHLRHLVVRRIQLVKMRAKEKNHRETMTDELTTSWSEMQLAIDKHIAKLDDVITEAVNSDEDLKKRAAVLSTIKGCALATSAAFLAFMPELGTISNKQASSLVGVAPFNNQSVDSDKPRSIYGGRRRLRSAIYMGALTAVAHDDKIRPSYERLIANKKPPMVAMTAAMRKMVVIANARMRDAFQPSNATPSTTTKQWTPRRRNRRNRAKGAKVTATSMS